jgi:pilus assembly protein Flp/PilA
MSSVLDYFYTMLQIVHGRIVQNRVDGAKDRGATAVEYGLLVGLIAVVIIAAVTLLGTRLKALFQSIVVSLGG